MMRPLITSTIILFLVCAGVVAGDQSSRPKGFDAAVDAIPKEASKPRGKSFLDEHPAYEFCVKARLLEAEASPDADRIIELYTSAIAADPRMAEAWKGRGIAWHEKGDYARAIGDLRKSLKLGPDDPVVLYVLGLAYLSAGDMKQAARSFESITRLEGEYYNAHAQLAYVHLSQGRFEEAAEILKYVQRNDPLNPLTYYYWGLLHYDRGAAKRAAADLSRAIELGNKSVETYGARGTAFKAMREYKKAVADFTEVIKLAPQDRRGYANRGSAFLADGQPEKAVEDLTKVIELSSCTAQGYLDRANVLLEQDKYELALQDYNRAIELDPENACLVYNDRGRLYKVMGRRQEALRDFDALIALRPKEAVEAYVNRGMLLAEDNRFPEALKALDRAVALRPSDPRLYTFRGSVYKEIGNTDKAMADFGTALRLDPLNKEAYLNRGHVYDQERDYLHAVKDFEKVLSIDPSDGYAKESRERICALLAEEQRKRLYQGGLVTGSDMFDAMVRTIEAHYVDERGDTIRLDTAQRPDTGSLLRQLDERSFQLDYYHDLLAVAEPGLRVEVKGGTCTVITPAVDSPAFEAGIRPGDRVVKLDGRPVSELPADRIYKSFYGDFTTELKVLIETAEGERREYVLPRKLVMIRPVRTAPIDRQGIGYIQLMDIRKEQLEEVRETIAGYLKKGLKGLVLDLRYSTGDHNGGVTELCEEFLPAGAVTLRYKGTQANSGACRYATRTGNTRLPVVIIVNRGTIGIVEVLAAALQCNGRAKVVGETTFGDGSDQDMFPLRMGQGLCLTTGYYFTPKGDPITGRGITPDVPVTDTVDPTKDVYDFDDISANTFDAQLMKAYELLRD